MLPGAIEIRKIHAGEKTQYEVFDSDTGTGLGVYDDLERAEAERQNLKHSEAALHIRSKHDDTDTG